MRSVCLTLMVKDEARYIRAALESAKGLYDRLTVVDTGSTDGTQAIIREVAPEAVIVDRAWVSYAHGRNETLRLAEKQGCDYILMMDGDETFADKPDGWGQLTADVYYLHYAGEFDSAQARLIKAGYPWEYKDPVHAYLDCAAPGLVHEHLARPRIVHHGEIRHFTEKLVTDIQTLVGMVESGGASARTVFNLAKALEGLGERDEAERFYRHRVELGDDSEEAFYARYKLGCLLAMKDFAAGARELVAAWEMRPWRVEPLRTLAIYATDVAEQIPVPTDEIMFVQRSWYEGTPENLIASLNRVVGGSNVPVTGGAARDERRPPTRAQP